MKYKCLMCGEIYDEVKEGRKFSDLPDDWVCPICGAPKSLFKPIEEPASTQSATSDSLDSSASEAEMSYIQQIATSGEIVIEPAGAQTNLSPWSDVLVLAAQLSRQPLTSSQPVDSEVVIGPNAKKPLTLESPLIVSHMSYGALTGETKVNIAKGAKQAHSAVGSGEGGLYEPEFEANQQVIFEYVPNKYSANDANLQKVAAIEIKIGQSAKPGLGGHLPGSKVTPEIAKMRGFPVGEDIVSPPAFPDLKTPDDLKSLVDQLRDRSGGRPIGVKIAANDIEADLEWIKFAQPDFITIDGRGGGTGAAPKLWKETAGVPTLYALIRARRYLDDNKMSQQLIVTGGLRTSDEIVKCLALGADAVALATGVLTALAAPSDTLAADQKVANYLNVTLSELKTYARACGVTALRDFNLSHLATADYNLATHTPIRHVGI